MAQEVVCPVCDADIPVDEDAKAGESIYCESCKTELTLVKVRFGDKEKLTADFEEEY